MLVGKDKKLRRSSIDVQQQFIWKQKQNLENIKLLKETTSNQSPSTKIDKDDKPSNEMKAKLLASKLSARKLKFSTAFTLNSDKFVNNTIERNNIQSSSGSNNQDNIVKYEFKNNEVEILLQEKQHWLTRMHEDNIKMAKILDDLKKTKQNVSSKMHELNFERNKLRSILTSEGQVYSVDAIETYLVEESMLSPANQAHFLPSNRILEATKLLQELLILSAGLKSNQSEVNEYFFSTLHHCIDDFVSEANGASSSSTSILFPSEEGEGRYINKTEQSRLYHKSLKILRTLASSGPGNIHAAQKLSIAATDTLINAICDQTDKKHSDEEKQGSGLNNIQELLIENETLKLKLSQEKKKNALLQSKLSAVAATATTKTSISSSSPSINPSTNPNQSFDLLTTIENNSERSNHITGPGKLFLESILLDKYEIFDKYLLQNILKLVDKVIASQQQLTAKLDSESMEILQSSICNDIIESTRLSLASYIHNELDISTLHVDDVNTIDDIDSLKEYWFRNAVDHILKSSFVNSKLAALSSFYLTYLHINDISNIENSQSPIIDTNYDNITTTHDELLESEEAEKTGRPLSINSDMSYNSAAVHSSEHQSHRTGDVPRYMIPRQGSLKR